MIYLIFSICVIIALSFCRITVFTVSVISMLIWSVPNIFENVWTSTASFYAIVILLHLSFAFFFQSSTRPCFVNKTLDQRTVKGTSYITILFFCLIVYLDRGISSFLAGKYGPTPGGSIILYYLFATSLYLASLGVFLLKENKLKKIVTLILLILIFLGGDRTVIILSFIGILLFRFRGQYLYQILLGRTALTLIPITLFFFVSKEIYSTYASGNIREIEIGMYLLEKSLNSSEFFLNNLVMKYSLVHSFSYGPLDYAINMMSFFPGSSFLGVDPHQFSNEVKQHYFSSWSEGAGVGASFLGQSFAVFTVFLFIPLLLWSVLLIIAEAKYRENFYIFSLVPFLTFYIHRLTLEQLLSFSGRLLLIYTVVVVAQKLLPRHK